MLCGEVTPLHTLWNYWRRRARVLHAQQTIYKHKRDIIDLCGRRSKEERPTMDGPTGTSTSTDKAHALVLHNLDQKRALFCIWPFYRWQGRPPASGKTRDPLCLFLGASLSLDISSHRRYRPQFNMTVFQWFWLCCVIHTKRRCVSTLLNATHFQPVNVEMEASSALRLQKHSNGTRSAGENSISL